MSLSSLTRKESYGACSVSNPCLLGKNPDLRGSEVFDSVINFNGHIKAVTRALEEYRKESNVETPAAAASSA